MGNFFCLECFIVSYNANGGECDDGGYVVFMVCMDHVDHDYLFYEEKLEADLFWMFHFVVNLLFQRDIGNRWLSYRIIIYCSLGWVTVFPFDRPFPVFIIFIVYVMSGLYSNPVLGTNYPNMGLPAPRSTNSNRSSHDNIDINERI